MEKEINIAAILEGKPSAKLWSPIIGDCTYSNYYPSTEEIFVNFTNRYGEEGEWIFHQSGRTLSAQNTAEVCLFPSKQMRDWSKFAWKKGDVLATDINTYCIFDSWKNDAYTQFRAKYICRSSDCHFYSDEVKPTCDWTRVKENDIIEYYINIIERSKGGKLNLETLEIEKPQFKDGDIVFVECVEEREADYIVICKNINNHKISDYCSLNISSSSLDYTGENGLLLEFYKLRLATDSEKQQLFAALEKENKAWDAEKKTIVDLPKKYEFKTMDYFLARYNYSKYALWNLYQYAYTDKDGYIFVVNESCIEADKYTCIPYNDQTAHLLGTTDDWKGGNND